MVDWDKATFEALQEDVPRTAAILSDEVLARVTTLENENAGLKESLADVRAMFALEDRGWALITGLNTGERLEGLDLDELKEISEAIRPHLVGDGLVKRGADLHSGYVWSKGLGIEGVASTGKQGRPTNSQTFYEDPINQESIFSALSHEEIQKARYADGNVFLAVNKSTREVRRIPLNQITGLRVNPDFPEEVWAWQRTWNPNDRPDSKQKVLWYYTPRFKGKRQKSYTEGGKTVAISETEIVIDRRFNRQIGYPLGIPDAVAAMPWIAAYTEIINYGRVVNESLAKILFKIISKTSAGARTAGVKIANMSGHGNAASMVEGQDAQAISTAGKGYDFTSARPVASMAAAALNVPNIELLSDSSAAGSSYGAAQSLSPATKNAMRLMQAEWIELFEEIFNYLGLGRPRIWFDPLEDPDPYRAAQQLKILSDGLSDEEYRGKVLDLLDIAGNAADIPEILALRTLAAKTAAEPAQAASPDQGQSNGSGGGGQGANDQRTDGIGEMLNRMQDDAFLDNLRNLVERLESIS